MLYGEANKARTRAGHRANQRYSAAQEREQSQAFPLGAAAEYDSFASSSSQSCAPLN